MIYCYTLLSQAEIGMGNQCCNSEPHSKLQLSPQGKDLIVQHQEVSKLLQQVEIQKERSPEQRKSKSPSKNGLAYQAFTIEQSPFYMLNIPGNKRQYFVTKEIGAGSFGIVFSGYYKENDKEQKVAVKMFKCFSKERIPQAKASFERQLKMHQKLQESYQENEEIRLIDFYQKSEQMSFYLILKLQDNKCLYKLLTNGMNEHMVSGLLKSIVFELQNWQRNEFIHLDIKSSNILITSPSESADRIVPLAILTDYGLSYKADQSTWNKIKGQKIGTKYHQAPQLIQNLYPNMPYKKQNLFKLDIFSLGVTLYQWLTSTSSKQPNFYGFDIPLGSFQRYSYEFYSMKQRIQNKDRQVITFFIKKHQMWHLILNMMLQPNPEERCSLNELSQIFQILHQTFQSEFLLKQEDYKHRTGFSGCEWSLLILRIILDNYLKYLSKIKPKNDYHFGVIKYLANYILSKNKSIYRELLQGKSKDPYYNSLPSQCLSNTQLQNPLPSTILSHLRLVITQKGLERQQIRKCVCSLLNLYDKVAFYNYITNTYKIYMQWSNQQINQQISVSLQKKTFQMCILEGQLGLQKSIANKIMNCLNSENTLIQPTTRVQ